MAHGDIHHGPCVCPIGSVRLHLCSLREAIIHLWLVILSPGHNLGQWLRASCHWTIVLTHISVAPALNFPRDSLILILPHLFAHWTRPRTSSLVSQSVSVWQRGVLWAEHGSAIGCFCSYVTNTAALYYMQYIWWHDTNIWLQGKSFQTFHRLFFQNV